MKPYQHLIQLVEQHAIERPNDIAYISMGNETTWGQYIQDIYRVANSFIKLGLKRGDKIATILPQTPAFMNIYMAASALGLVLVPLDPRFKKKELIDLAERTKPKLLVAMANIESVKLEIEQFLELRTIEHVYSYMGSFDNLLVQPYERLLEETSSPLSSEYLPSPEDPFVIVFTSGSTGLPKGAMLTYNNTFAMASNFIKTWQFTHKDRILMNLTNSHVGGTHNHLAVQLYSGCVAVLSPKFSPIEVLEFISKYKVTYILGVTTMFRLMFNSYDVKKYNVSSLRIVAVSGENVPKEFVIKMKDNFPKAVIGTGWGMTETSGFYSYTRIDDSIEVISQTAGIAADGFEMKIVKGDGTNATTGEVGEIYVRGDSVMPRYMDEDHNVDAFDQGWLKTGDLGYLDNRNYLHFVGRVKEIYISGGYNVSTREIESFLNEHPKINTSCIIDVPDEVWGQSAYAFIVPKENTNLTIEEVAAYCKENLANYKQPRKIIFVNEIPKTTVGKIAKHVLRSNIHKYVMA
nr:class I adenylate-forming enzyme family protein [Fredinandcohnia onubensis]